jgi:hypothetical protein
LLLSLLHVGREVPRTAMEHIEIDRHLELSRDPSDAEPPGPGPEPISNAGTEKHGDDRLARLAMVNAVLPSI